MADLTCLNEACVLHNLKERFITVSRHIRDFFVLL
ncbi:unnamed protein product [Enterobius vermicularis]|uniref:Uncharacterized protein n=1 Tax=Enterobius vermicularis TaxID=51028 RepID=A0A0N4VPP9_ENTVE|nr:unnamed protein product [Enterobius vermicularis]